MEGVCFLFFQTASLLPTKKLRTRRNVYFCPTAPADSFCMVHDFGVSILYAYMDLLKNYYSLRNEKGRKGGFRWLEQGI